MSEEKKERWAIDFSYRHGLSESATIELSEYVDEIEAIIPELPDFDDERTIPHERFYAYADRFLKELAGQDDDVVLDALARVFAHFFQAKRAEGPKTFEEAWAEMEAQGYRYGEDALQGVRFGWNIRGDVEARRDPAAEMAIAIMFAEWVSKMAVRMFWKTELCANGIHSGDRGGCEYCGKDE